ncbi:hypothetical protein [Cellulosilyticum sp. I15G10I2]|uniref:hypothetical protein n=1 Tax=Cellulosilyticum sp. I15G10I2 TaxID=1892843 RepID=UPI00085C56F6|nr:hypothetical protein [Cellulosilyticum sp. I15G10I2]
MSEVLENLKNSQILYNQNVIDLKESIRRNYPHYDNKRAALLFAAAIHKIIDQNIVCFDQSIQTDIKNSLLQEVIKKEVFDITAYDIFKACSLLDMSDDYYCEMLTEWVNYNQEQTISKHQLLKLLLQLNTNASNNVHPTIAQVRSFNLLNLFIPHKRLALTAAMLSLTTIVLTQALHYKNVEHVNDTISYTPTTVTQEATHSLADHHSAVHVTDQDNGLHKTLHYKEVNTDALHNWLNERNSVLADEPYFSSILDTAYEFNINPLLMFAITGQEQSFVPRSNTHASLIANNPFNVYGSWKRFNTDINEASRIAARTILNLSKGCPQNEDPLKWINRKYAEDPNWHLGVAQILLSLEKTAGD